MKLNLTQRNSIIEQYLPQASKIAYNKKKQLPTIDVKEIESAAHLGLVEAAARFDTDQGEFWPFAVLRIVGEIQDYLRSLGFGSKGSVSKGCIKFGSLDQSLEDDRRQSISAFLADKKSNWELAFEELTEGLAPDGKQLLWQRFVEGRKAKEIAKDLGVSEPRISQLVTSYCKQLAA